MMLLPCLSIILTYVLLSTCGKFNIFIVMVLKQNQINFFFCNDYLCDEGSTCIKEHEFA